MKILLTGANGQVADAVGRDPQSAGDRLMGFDRQTLDISNHKEVFATLADVSPDVVINAAAYTAVDKAESDAVAAFAVNRDGPAHLAAACAQARIPLIHISTDYVFDGTLDRAYREDDAASPQSVYGQSKWEGEEAVRNVLTQHVIFRVSWVFGSHGHNFVRTMLRLGRDRDQLKIVADQQGGPTYAGDIARLLLTAARKAVSVNQDSPMNSEHACWGTFHFCGQPTTTWKDFATEIFDEAHRQGMIDRGPRITPIPTTEYPTPARRPLNSVLDCTRVQNVFQAPVSHWRDGLKNVLAQWKLEQGIS